MTTTIETGKVQERRRLRFNNVDELRAEIDRILTAERAGTLRRSGNWTTGRVFGHLATWINYGYEGFPMRPPWFRPSVPLGCCTATCVPISFASPRWTFAASSWHSCSSASSIRSSVTVCLCSPWT